MNEDKNLKNIARIDQESKVQKKKGQHGWSVRFRRKKQPYQHFFNDDKYGGKDKCLEAAVLFRDAVKIQFLEDPNTEALLDGTRQISKRNKSGITGVCRTSYTYTKRGKKYKGLAWQSHWPVGNGKSTAKKYSIHKHGEEGAFRLALKAREEGISKLKRTSHPALLPPENENQKIWRYMDFTKFTSMLEESALFFSSVSMLNDPFEGSLTNLNKLLRPLIFKKKDPNEASSLFLKLRNEVAVNCWHSSDYESAAMWELYSKSEESVCIQTTYQKLSASFLNEVEIGIVQYADYNKEYIPEHDPYLAFLYKRKSFEHEREIRGVIKKLNSTHQGCGKLVKIDLNYLIDNIYISPNSPAWFFKLIKKTIKRYELIKPVIQSSLSDDPVY